MSSMSSGGVGAVALGGSAPAAAALVAAGLLAAPSARVARALLLRRLRRRNLLQLREELRALGHPEICRQRRRHQRHDDRDGMQNKPQKGQPRSIGYGIMTVREEASGQGALWGS